MINGNYTDHNGQNYNLTGAGIQENIIREIGFIPDYSSPKEKRTKSKFSVVDLIKKFINKESKNHCEYKLQKPISQSKCK